MSGSQCQMSGAYNESNSMPNNEWLQIETKDKYFLLKQTVFNL